jgi:hypothetical protein
MPHTKAAVLGAMATRTDIPSGNGPYRVYPTYITHYPQSVIDALAALYLEYNRAFAPLVEANREWDTDYRYCMEDEGLVNYFVQIDMAGLAPEFLAQAAELPVEIVKEQLRFLIFEIENSIAVYPLLRNLFPRDPHPSYFLTRFDAVLAGIKKRHGQRPIALLAVTDEKYAAICKSEFGVAGARVTDEEVRRLSGFDRLFGPDDFRRHVDETGGSEYLLYVRSSDPVSVLKDPTQSVEHPLLADETMRRIIKKHSLTLNIDAPGMSYAKRINDTKGYMPWMGIAHPIEAVHDLYGQPFRWFLRARGVNPDDVLSGEMKLRAKPAKGTYGCYGHYVGSMTSGLPRKVKGGIQRRGPYMVQPELPPYVVGDRANGAEYNAIDRIFFGIIRGGKPFFLQGFRSLMPVDSIEAQEGRNHGNVATVWAEVRASKDR